MVRTSDRLEALTVLVVLGLSLIAVPIAATAGSQVFASTARTADEQAHARHSIQATVVEGSTGLPSEFDTTQYVRAQWREGSQRRTERVLTAARVDAGSAMTLWLDETGKVVAPPLKRADAQVSAIAAAATLWFAVVVCCAIAAVGVRWGLDRSRDRAWERELRLLAHNDDGWANRRI